MEEAGAQVMRDYGSYVKGIELDEGGSLRVVLTGAPQLEERAVTFSMFERNGFVNWRCQADPELPREWLPRACGGTLGKGGVSRPPSGLRAEAAGGPTESTARSPYD